MCDEEEDYDAGCISPTASELEANEEDNRRAETFLAEIARAEETRARDDCGIRYWYCYDATRGGDRLSRQLKQAPRRAPIVGERKWKWARKAKGRRLQRRPNKSSDWLLSVGRWPKDTTPPKSSQQQRDAAIWNRPPWAAWNP